MRTNRKLGMLQSFIHQYTIIMFTVTMVVAVNKPTFKCPDPSQWKFRAKSICNDTEKYICLFDENGQRDEEFCGSWPDFENPGYKQILLGGTTRKPCSEYRFQPFTFWTNGSSKCVYKKTFCNQEGQVIYNNGTAQSDRTCRCDYTKNYDFQVKPENNCFCVPSREDCSCYVKPCPAGSRLTPDYECLEESRWKLSFFSCLEIKEDSIDDPVEMSTIISTYGYEMPSDSVAWPSVSVTVLCIAAACIVVLTYLLSKNRDSIEIKQTQKGKNDFNRNETTNIPIDVLDLQEKEIVKWRKRQQNFEETHASTTVLETVKTNGFVILSGPPGSGKSVIAYNTAFILEKKENFKIMPVSSPEEIRKYLLSKTKQVFVIDDPVGKYTVDDICIQRWKNEEIFIKQTFTDFSNTKLILTCRTYIYKSGFCRQLHVPPIHCDLLSHNLKLSLFERRKICRRYKIPELNEDTIMMYNCLPLLCVSYSNKEDTIDYFSNPYKVLTDEMINTKENSDIAFLAIAFLVVRDGTIEKQILTFANTETKDLLNDLCDECGFKYFPSTKVILTALCNLIGTYVTEKDDIFSFIHDNLFRNLSFIVGGYFIDCLLKYGSTDFWTKRLQFASLNKNHDELVIIVSPEHEKSYFERLILDIKKGHHRKVFTGIQMQFSEFRTNLVKELRHLHSEDFKSDDKKTTFLHVVAEQGYEDLVFEIVNLKRDQIDYQDTNGRTPLYMACLGGHMKAAQTLINFKASINIACNDNLTPIDTASSNGHYSVVDLLLKEGVKVNRKDKKKRTALHRAIENGHIDTVILLLENKADINQADKDGTKAIHEACSRGHLGIVERLLKYNDMINDRDNNDRTPLFIASESNHIDIVNMLLRYKANVNQTNKEHMTPLYKACQIGNVKIVGSLLDESAKVNVQSKDGFTPLYIACLEGCLNVVEILLNKKAEVNLATKQGWTPFLISCSEDRLEICKLLLHNGANINTGDISALTPLHVACRENHERIVRFLLDNNATVNAVDRRNVSPLHIGCMNKCFDIVELLLNHHADVNLCDINGNSPLHVACLKENKQIVNLLLDKKADILKQNNEGKTPYDVVQGREKETIIEMLNRYKEK